MAGLLVAELIAAVLLLLHLNTPAQRAAGPAPPASPLAPAADTVALPGGRTAQVVALGGPAAHRLLDRIAGQLGSATEAVTDFWGTDWPAEVVVVATGSPAEFGRLAGVGPDIAAATVDGRIVFAPGAAGMSDAALRVVLRHELFHFAARARTAADAPRWLTEGVADYVARPATPRPGPAGADRLAQLPTDAELDTPGPDRSLAYDRAWWFARFVAARYGPATLRRLYQRACGPGHPAVAVAVREVLDADLSAVLTGWRQWMAG